MSDIRDVSRKVRPLVTEKKFTSALSVLPCYVADPGHMDSYFVRAPLLNQLNQLRILAIVTRKKLLRGHMHGTRPLLASLGHVRHSVAVEELQKALGP